MTVILKKILTLLLIALTISGSGCIGEVKNVVTGIIKGTSAIVQGAEDYIPEKAPTYGDPYIQPWNDPGVDLPSDGSVADFSNTASSFTGYSPSIDIPEGTSVLSVEAETTYGQLEPDDGVEFIRLADTYDTFNQ